MTTTTTPKPAKATRISRVELEARVDSAVQALKIARDAKTPSASRPFITAALDVLDR